MSRKEPKTTGIDVKSPVFSRGLSGKCVFLSASFPTGERATRFPEADPFEITTAVVSLARATFGAKGRLLFGGHPTISPLVLSVGRDFLSYFSERERRSEGPLVYVYQSLYYKEIVPEETRSLEEEGVGKIVWAKSLSNARESLREMRTRMLREGKPVAGVFVGGMDGVFDPKGGEDEFHLFRQMCPSKPVYPLGSTGGAARALLDLVSKDEQMATSWRYSSVSVDELLQPASYSILTRDVVADIIEHVKTSVLTRVESLVLVSLISLLRQRYGEGEPAPSARASEIVLEGITNSVIERALGRLRGKGLVTIQAPGLLLRAPTYLADSRRWKTVRDVSDHTVRLVLKEHPEIVRMVGRSFIRKKLGIRIG
jgi:hypothetical protein